MLYVEDLKVEVGGKTILENVNMSIPRGQTHILFGPNGSGKSSLMMTIMGFSEYKVARGKITFNGEDVTHMPIHERAILGIGVLLQRPPTVNGLKTRTMVEICGAGKEHDIESMAEKLALLDFLERDVNHNFSGG